MYDEVRTDVGDAWVGRVLNIDVLPQPPISECRVWILCRFYKVTRICNYLPRQILKGACYEDAKQIKTWNKNFDSAACGIVCISRSALPLGGEFFV